MQITINGDVFTTKDALHTKLKTLTQFETNEFDNLWEELSTLASTIKNIFFKDINIEINNERPVFDMYIKKQTTSTENDKQLVFCMDENIQIKKIKTIQIKNKQSLT